MEPDEGVVLTVVADGAEADIVCGLLESNGIDCAYRDTEAIDSPLEDFTEAGYARDRTTGQTVQFNTFGFNAGHTEQAGKCELQGAVTQTNP